MGRGLIKKSLPSLGYCAHVWTNWVPSYQTHIEVFRGWGPAKPLDSSWLVNCSLLSWAFMFVSMRDSGNSDNINNLCCFLSLFLRPASFLLSLLVPGLSWNVWSMCVLICSQVWGHSVIIPFSFTAWIPSMVWLVPEVAELFSCRFWMIIPKLSQ